MNGWIVKGSDEDLGWLYPGRSPCESLKAWLELGPADVALTRGASGPVILFVNGSVEMHAIAAYANRAAAIPSRKGANRPPTAEIGPLLSPSTTLER